MRNQVVMFTLDEPCCALPISYVEKVIRAVEISQLPHAPAIILGVINMAGKIIPVVDVRKRFGFPERELSIDDRFIIAKTSRYVVALVVDAVDGFRELTAQQMVSVEQNLPFAEHLKGVATIEGNIIMIYDLDQFLSLDEELMLNKALFTSDKEKGAVN